MVVPEITFPLYSTLSSKYPLPQILPSSHNKDMGMDFGNIRKQTRRDKIRNPDDDV
jgi:hypothetical protein